MRAPWHRAWRATKSTPDYQRKNAHNAIAAALMMSAADPSQYLHAG